MTATTYFVVLTLLMAVGCQPVTFNVNLNLNDLIRQAKQEEAINTAASLTTPTPTYNQKVSEEEETVFSEVFTSDEEDRMVNEGFLTRNIESLARDNDAISIRDIASTDTTGLGMPSVGTGTSTSTGSVQIVINVVATDPEVAISNSV